MSSERVVEECLTAEKEGVGVLHVCAGTILPEGCDWPGGTFVPVGGDQVYMFDGYHFQELVMATTPEEAIAACVDTSSLENIFEQSHKHEEDER